MHFHVVSVAETGTSAAMEKHGLTKVLDKIDSLGVKVDCITTDDHPSVKKILRGKKERHQLDVWHKSKNIKKKITKLAKKS